MAFDDWVQGSRPHQWVTTNTTNVLTEEELTQAARQIYEAVIPRTGERVQVQVVGDAARRRQIEDEGEGL